MGNGEADETSDEPPRELRDEVLEQIAESREQIEACEYTEIEWQAKMARESDDRPTVEEQRRLAERAIDAHEELFDELSQE